MKWLMILALLPTSSYACDIEINLKNKAYKVCQKEDQIHSKDCEKPTLCFSLPKKMHFYQNQNPLFSLCYQSGGEPFYVTIKDKRKRVCLGQNNGISDLNTLMLEYRKSL